MVNNAQNVSFGKPKATGGIWIAPKGTTLPTDATTALSNSYLSLGYISEDGLTDSIETDTEEVKVWGGDTVLTGQTSFADKLTAFNVTSAGQELTGHLDELRVENVKRSDDFVATQYNTQNSPATFYSVGSEQTSGGGGSSNASARMLMGMGS